MYEIITHVIDEEELEHILCCISSVIFRRGWNYYVPKVMLFCNKEGMSAAASRISFAPSCPPDQLWDMFSEYAYISQEEFREFFSGAQIGTAYQIGHAVRLKPFKVDPVAIADSYMSMDELPEDAMKRVEKLLKRD